MFCEIVVFADLPCRSLAEHYELQRMLVSDRGTVARNDAFYFVVLLCGERCLVHVEDHF